MNSRVFLNTKISNVFRLGIFDKLLFEELFEEAKSRFEIEMGDYEITTFKTEEDLLVIGEMKTIHYICIKIEAGEYRKIGRLTAQVICFMELASYGINSGKKFDIDKSGRSIEIRENFKSRVVTIRDLALNLIS